MHKRKKVYCYSAETGAYLKGYPSVMDAAYLIGARTSNISACCNGRLRSTCGFAWSYTKKRRIDVKQDGRRREAEWTKKK